MWLVDENLPSKIFQILAKHGIRSQSVQFAGLLGSKNGVLTHKAASRGFTCILTQDKDFHIDAKAALREVELAVVVVTLPQVPLREYLTLFEETIAREPIVPVKGKTIFWPVPEGPQVPAEYSASF